MNNNHFKIAQDKIAGLRVLADALNFNELAVLVGLFGLRMTQECNLDMLSCGELDADELASCNTAEAMASCSVDMMTDMLNDMDLAAVIEVNELAEAYTLEVETKVVTVRKKV